MVVKNTNFWLNEEELKTPMHDKMVLWTFNNLETIFSSLPELVENRVTSKFKDINIVDNNVIIEADTSEEFDTPIKEEYNKIIRDFNIDFTKTKRIIEYPITTAKGFNLGFIDLLLLQGYYPIIKQYKFFTKDRIGWNDIAFEIKPKVKSIGDVLRQFQYYKSNMPYTHLVLVTTTTGLKNIFQSQGFFVYEYKEEDEKNGK